MKKIVLFLMGLIFLQVSAIAYQVSIEAPETLTVGKPLVVTGTTTFGIGTPIDVVLYYQLTTTTEVKRKIAYIQPDKSFKAVFDTTGLKTGTYKVEVPTSGMGGDSVTTRVIQLVDRSDAIQISSSLTQPFSGRMVVAGTISGGETSGIQIEVLGPDGGVIAGPRYVNTNYLGDFSVEIPITEAGDYEVSFTDSRGYIGEKTFTILSEPALVDTPSSEPTPGLQILSAHGRSSYDMPAYFRIVPGTGPVTIYTSASLDWVLEYIDENGELHTINDKGTQVPERVSLIGKGKTLYFRIYPATPAASGEVVIYGQNVQSVDVSPDILPGFVHATPTPPEETPISPFLPVGGIIAAGIVAAALKRVF